MRAVTWHGKRDVRYVDVPDPKIEEGTDALIRVTSTNICGSEVDLREHESDVGDVLRDMTGGRGPDSVIDAVGMEAHGSPVPKLAQTLTGLLPDAIAKPLMANVGVDRLTALYTAIDAVRRGGTISLHAYEQFQKKKDGTVKVVMTP